MSSRVIHADSRQSPITEKPTKADEPLPGQLGLFG